MKRRRRRFCPLLSCGSRIPVRSSYCVSCSQKGPHAAGGGCTGKGGWGTVVRITEGIPSTPTRGGGCGQGRPRSTGTTKQPLFAVRPLPGLPQVVSNRVGACSGNTSVLGSHRKSVGSPRLTCRSRLRRDGALPRSFVCVSAGYLQAKSRFGPCSGKSWSDPGAEVVGEGLPGIPAERRIVLKRDPSPRVPSDCGACMDRGELPTSRGVPVLRTKRAASFLDLSSQPRC